MIVSVTIDILFIENLWIYCDEQTSYYGNDYCWYYLNGDDDYVITSVIIGFGILVFTWILFIVNHSNFYSEIKKLKDHQDLTRPNLFQSPQIISTEGQLLNQQSQYYVQNTGSVAYPSYVNQTPSVSNSPSTVYQQQSQAGFQTGQPSRSLSTNGQQDRDDAYSLL
ncbi:MAG: hypothetical protein VW862_06370, partial [Euryarchaeota archaeon]